jgi:hypothetical protein
MAQQVAKARVLIPVTSTTVDAASIDFIFEATGSDTSLDFTSVVNPLTVVTDFFNTTAGGASVPLSHWLGNVVDTGANHCSITWTDVTNHLDGTPAGSPFRIDAFTMGAVGSSSLPGQISLCAAYRSDYGSAIEHGPMTSVPSDDDAIDQGAPPTHMGQERPRARHRGRFFFGPLSGSTLGTAPNWVNAQTLADLQFALRGMALTKNSGLHNQFNLVQWSRRDASIAAVRWVYINENFATQRRRTDVTAARVHSWVAV